MQLEGRRADVVERVAEHVDRPAVDRLHRNALEDVGQAVVEAAGVVLAVVHLDAVVGAFGDVVAVEVDGRAGVDGERVDGVGEAANAVVADDVPRAGHLYAAAAFDALRPRPGRAAGDHVVGDVDVLLALAVPRGDEAVVDVDDAAAADGEPRPLVDGDGVLGVAHGEVLEHRVVQAGLVDRHVATAAAVDDRLAVARADQGDRFARLAGPRLERALVDALVQQQDVAGRESLIACSRPPGCTSIFRPPVGSCGSLQVFIFTVCCASPPSGSTSDSRSSYSVFSSRSKIEPASIVSPAAGRFASRIARVSTRNRSSPFRHAAAPALRYSTATFALRFSSPPIIHRTPRHFSVGISSISLPGFAALSASAGEMKYKCKGGKSRRKRAGSRDVHGDLLAGGGGWDIREVP